jgi:hypothetical protein
MAAGDRHTPLHDVLRQIGSGAPISFAIEGSPSCQIRILPVESVIEVLVRGDSSQPNVAALRNVHALSVDLDNERWGAISVNWRTSPIEAYMFSCAVVDRIQIESLRLAEAVDVVVREMRDIMRREQTLERDAEVGLAGELIVLLSLIRSHHGRDAVDSWLGSSGEEHDFALPTVDLEVKTTTSEGRIHWIGSVRQLRGLPGRALRLVSIQLTPKVGEGSRTLGEIAGAAVSAAGARGGEVTSRLEAVGYFSSDSDLYRTSWALRDEILEFEVDAGFPRIIEDQLATLGLSLQTIVELRYRLCVDGLTHRLETTVPYMRVLEEL